MSARSTVYYYGRMEVDGAFTLMKCRVRPGTTYVVEYGPACVRGWDGPRVYQSTNQGWAWQISRGDGCYRDKATARLAFVDYLKAEREKAAVRAATIDRCLTALDEDSPE